MIWRASFEGVSGKELIVSAEAYKRDRLETDQERAECSAGVQAALHMMGALGYATANIEIGAESDGGTRRAVFLAIGHA